MSRILSRKARELLERPDVRRALQRVANEEGRIGARRIEVSPRNGTLRENGKRVELVERRSST